MGKSLNTKVVKASKWSALTEILSRLVAPISSMVLARLLTPEAFGIVTTIMMIITFAEIFSDAGFQKYIIQHEFENDIEKEKSINVAFWSNFSMSLIIWGIVALFNSQLATFVGNPGLGYVLIIACVSIPLAAFSSIQIAIYKRDLDFKTLFKVRVVGILIPLLVTIPFALWLRNFWALIIGNIAKDVVNAILLTYYSPWKPRLYYSIIRFNEMFSFTMWSMFESLSIWLTGYADVFIVGTYLNQYYLGLYKTSTVTVGHMVAMITAATTPILFSSLSRLQNNDEEFKELFFKFQKIVGMLIFPLCIAIFCYSDLVTEILLGHQWMEASGFIGLWALMSSVSVVLSHYASEVYRSKGKPKLSTIAQLLHIVVMCPAVFFAVKYDFTTLYVTRSLVRLELILVNLVLLYYLVHFTLSDMLINLKAVLLASAGMLISSMALEAIGISCSILSQVFLCFISLIVYLVIILQFKEERYILLNIRKILKK